MKRFEFSCLPELRLFSVYFCLIVSLIALANLYVACVASLSVRVRRESWDESKKRITRLETLATQANLYDITE